MSPEAFNFYLRDQSVDPVGSVLFNATAAFKVVGLQHEGEDEKNPPVAMLCEDVLGHGSQLIVNLENCSQFQMSVEVMPGHVQAVWAMCMKEITDLKAKLRSV